ncbi:hypothetical protein BRAO375_740017 [Bradyrhizobium sp. ORS 375]|uniref:hypothetical protein n=1 Tax=Bradyrhizobium sp. (strain ORS 375) TaxID=566679 RepID=UPI0002406AA8|nr:hypothetical protein [Bradyrhizobium sp. ORS 375]CCD96734.1 hypothetical protein BRAO375_740017 [Bradyrhizobium sp. ORS 375]
MKLDGGQVNCGERGLYLEPRRTVSSLPHEYHRGKLAVPNIYRDGKTVLNSIPSDFLRKAIAWIQSERGFFRVSPKEWHAHVACMLDNRIHIAQLPINVELNERLWI